METSTDILEFLRARRMFWPVILIAALILISGVYIVASQPDVVIVDFYPL